MTTTSALVLYQNPFFRGIIRMIFKIVHTDSAPTGGCHTLKRPEWLNQTKSESAEQHMDVLIQKIQGGDQELLEQMILDYRPFVLRCVSTFSGSYVDTTQSDEFSISLIAFHEAIRTYNPEKGRNFLRFAEQVIRNRLIDHTRRNRSERNVVPFTSMTSTEEDSPRFEDSVVDSVNPYERVEDADELFRFQETLSKYGIRLKELVQLSPKHKDSRLLCITLARSISENPVLKAQLQRTKALPIQGLLANTDISRKTVERNRKFIIALVLVLDSKLEILKGYLDTAVKGGEF